MKLLIDNSWKHGQVPVSWCLDREDRSKIKKIIEEQAKLGIDVTPHVVIDVIPDGKTDTRIRQIAKLTQQKAFITFNVAGKNKVFAAIVFAKNGLSEENMRAGLRVKHGRGYYQTVFHAIDDDFGDDLGPNYDALSKINSGNIGLLSWSYRTVDVPEQWFAKEPPKWLKKYATMYWSSENKDECNMRKKIIFAFTIQTFIIIPFLSIIGIAYGFVLFTIAFFLTFIMGFRDTDWQMVWQQLKKPYYPVQDIALELFQSCRSYTYVPKDDKRKDGKWDLRSSDRFQYQSYFAADSEGYLRPWYIQILRPWLVILSLLIGSLVLEKISLTSSSWLVYLPLAVIVGGIALYCFLWFLSLMSLLFGKLKDRKQKKEELEIDVLQYEKRLLQSKIDNLLLCDDAISDENLPDIPEEERTVYLRFLEFKGKVCKSYQQG